MDACMYVCMFSQFVVVFNEEELSIVRYHDFF